MIGIHYCEKSTFGTTYLGKHSLPCVGVRSIEIIVRDICSTVPYIGGCRQIIHY